MAAKSNQPLPAGHRLPGYRLLGLLARGGFSFVYLAEDDAGEHVAIKEYLPSALSVRTGASPTPSLSLRDARHFRDGMRCFFEEGRVLASLSHPNVVRVLNFFRANETAYMVMRLERGSTLKQRLQQATAPLAEGWLRRTVVQLLNGLREVHARKLLHLDIKPANIHLREDASPVLIDFGASRRMLGADNASLRPIFTPGLAAPEMQSDRTKLGPWSDIYSVGATLYACMFMRPPPPATERIADDRCVPAASAGAGKYSAALLGLVDWCLRLDPLERPQSVLALQKALLGPGNEAARVPQDPKAVLRWIMGV
jgi:serine/threonine protein kinase